MITKILIRKPSKYEFKTLRPEGPIVNSHGREAVDHQESEIGSAEGAALFALPERLKGCRPFGPESRDSEHSPCPDGRGLLNSGPSGLVAPGFKRCTLFGDEFVEPSLRHEPINLQLLKMGQNRALGHSVGLGGNISIGAGDDFPGGRRAVAHGRED